MTSHMSLVSKRWPWIFLSTVSTHSPVKYPVAYGAVMKEIIIGGSQLIEEGWGQS